MLYRLIWIFFDFLCLSYSQLIKFISCKAINIFIISSFLTHSDGGQMGRSASVRFGLDKKATPIKVYKLWRPSYVTKTQHLRPTITKYQQIQKHCLKLLKTLLIKAVKSRLSPFFISFPIILHFTHILTFWISTDGESQYTAINFHHLLLFLSAFVLLRVKVGLLVGLLSIVTGRCRPPYALLQYNDIFFFYLSQTLCNFVSLPFYTAHIILF